MGLLAGYGYRALIPIDDTGGFLQNYQKLLTIVRGSGANTAGTIYLNNHALNWPLDIRFTEDDGATPVDFCRIEYDATNGSWWVELPATPASGSTDYYIYYGKSTDIDASSGEDTFEFFDDFEDGTLDKWDLTYNTDEDWINEADGDTRVASDAIEQSRSYIAIDEPQVPYIIETKIRWTVVPKQSPEFHVRTSGLVENSWPTNHVAFYPTTGNQLYIGKNNNGAGYSEVGTRVSYTQDTEWHLHKFVVDGNNYQWWIDGIKYRDEVITVQTANKILAFSIWSGHSHLDDVRVRKYADPEPVWDTPGSETKTTSSHNSINRGMAVFA